MKTQLQPIYGANATVQIPRYSAAVKTFADLYGPGELLIFRAPGRVNLIGEHTDYNHGYVMPVALDKDVVLLARPRDDGRVHIHNIEPDFHPVEFIISQNIEPGSTGDWGNFARGPAQLMIRELKRPLLGFDGLISAAPPYGVPRSAGLSSSSAVTVVNSVALSHLNGWHPEGTTLAGFCSEAEWYVGTRGGIMDQFISVLGQKDHALFLDCRPGPDGRYHTQHVPLPPGYSLIIINSGIKHNNVGGGYNHRVAACRAGVGLLQPTYPDITHLRDVENVPWVALESLLPETRTVSELNSQGIDLGDIPNITSQTTLKLRARCRHVWTENQRVKDAVTALKEGNVLTLGQLLKAAHTSARDDYEISCPEIESLVSILDDAPGVVAARLTGAGWGGCVVALVEETAVTTTIEQVQTRYLAATNLQADVFACQPSGGAGLVGRFEIGNRMLL